MSAREPAIAARAADWLESMGLEVYEEVRVTGYGGRIADLVGVGAAAIVVVETKVRLGLDVIEQADYWQRYANATWAAFADIRTPRGHRTDEPRTRRLALWLCEQRGIGVLSVPGNDGEMPRIVVPAQVRRCRGSETLREALAPEQLRGAGGAQAGTKGGGYHTPFRRTANLVAEIVAEHPAPDGIDIKSLCAEVNARGGHHYGSGDKGFCAQIPILAKRGVIRGVRVQKIFGRRSTVLLPTDGGEP